ncbi:TIGR03792 family protein [filamentous cyanobacterium LEGE 11480]|uniref:TIGR03792 family protein n=1 Tax=Romeriopsis navalis LEGE 11480 TaxID=2777977 RepID=A0A928VPX8_9CYAN|nr:TIGR03792 family protein [Romeriopsis navalis]MBE9029969.1 TIGR03792 family protein [Romeriopsis navalis LEGE 11480]
MVIEWLTLMVPADWHERFIAADTAIWTHFLAQQPGYVGKQIWRNPAKPDELTLLIHWQSRQQWKAIAPTALAAVEQEFRQNLGRSFDIIAANEYQPLADGSISSQRPMAD